MARPIVLAHGIARFDELACNFGWGESYFKGIPEELEKDGFTVFSSHVDFAGSVEKRSKELEAEVDRILDESGADKVHVIGHSMGGLDARHMIVDLGMADKVASLTTIGTPHNGTSFADVGLENGGILIGGVGALGIDISGFEDLSTKACREFNERAEDAEATNPVRYVVYSSHQAKPGVFFLFQISWQIIHDREGDNDGLVPVSSQEWTPKLRSRLGIEKVVERRRFEFPADHLNQIGSWDLNEFTEGNFSVGSYERRVREIYLQIARDVVSREEVAAAR